jgi:hypothetical protein
VKVQEQAQEKQEDASLSNGSEVGFRERRFEWLQRLSCEQMPQLLEVQPIFQSRRDGTGLLNSLPN